MREKLLNEIKNAFAELIEKDGILFDCPVEEYTDYDARKLHEVCINHKLSTYLEKNIFPILEESGESLFTDIEFNREGINFKDLTVEDKVENVRPDIIIHNRKSGNDKFNFLVVECKKERDDDDDKKKLNAFLHDPKYFYQFALQVIYTSVAIHGTLFYRNRENETESETIEVIRE